MKPVLIILALTVLSSGCGRKADSEAAVKEAVQRYLASRPNLNMQGMDVNVSGIKFRGQTAEADVVFRARNDAKAVLSMHYTLKRQGNRWEVEPQTAGHGGATPEMPAGPPPAGSTMPPSSDLPAGHPPVKPK